LLITCDERMLIAVPMAAWCKRGPTPSHTSTPLPPGSGRSTSLSIFPPTNSIGKDGLHLRHQRTNRYEDSHSREGTDGAIHLNTRVRTRLIRTPYGMFLEESHAAFRCFHALLCCLEMLFRRPHFRSAILMAKTEAFAVCTRGMTHRNTSSDAWARQMPSEEPV